MSRAATSRLKVNPILGSPPSLEFRPIEQLHVDADYQRSVETGASQALIRQIAQFWDWGLCQPLSVSRRNDGKLYVVDGQHRLAAARLRDDVVHLPCVISFYDSGADEAAAFVALNRLRRPLTKIELFRGALAAGDTTAIAILAALEDNDLGLAPHQNFATWKPGQVGAIGVIERAWRQHGSETTTRAIELLAAAFEGQVHRYAGTLFGGLVGLALDGKLDSEGGFAAAVGTLGGHDQTYWRKLIQVRAAEHGERVTTAATAVFRAALQGPAARAKAVGDAVDAARAAGREAEPLSDRLARISGKTFCNQCDRQVTATEVERCTDRFCKAGAMAA